MNKGKQTPYVERIGEVTVITLGREYTNYHDAEMQRLEALLLKSPELLTPPLAVLDMSQTTFVATHFLELVNRTRARLLLQPNGHLALCCLSEHCTEITQITRLNEIWEIYDTLADALAALDPQ